MADTAHTPTEGPWIFDGEYILAPDGSVIADLLGSVVSEDEDASNGPLLAAALDLLMALQALHRECVRQDIKFGPLIADAEAAIAKALPTATKAREV